MRTVYYLFVDPITLHFSMSSTLATALLLYSN